MAALFHLTVVTPERTVLSEDVVGVIAPGLDGYFGVWAHHAPLLAGLGVGVLTLKREDGEEARFALAGGFMEVRDDAVTILADSVEPQSAIDILRAQNAERRARERLAHDQDVDIDRAQLALHRALNRLNVASRSS